MYTEMWKLGTLNRVKRQSDLIGDYELTQMFDIDKLYLSTLNFNMKYDQATGQTTIKEFEEGTYEYYANQALENYLAILKNTDVASNILHGSIDTDSELVKSVIRDIEATKTKEALLPYESYMLRVQSQTKDEFITGKVGIGPFALANNIHVLTMLYGVKFAGDVDSIMTRLGLTRLDLSEDRYGNSIMSWLSGLINAHVDVAKDPYISRLNVNSYTWGIVELLVSTGLGKDTFYFTSQPIMKMFATAFQNASGVYMTDQSKSKSAYQKEQIAEVWKSLISTAYGEAYRSLHQARIAFQSQFKKDHSDLSINDAITALFKPGEDTVFRQIAKDLVNTPNVDIVNSKLTYKIDGLDGEFSLFEIQMLCAEANDQFEPYTRALSELTNCSKIDTKKQGSTLMEQRKYKQAVQALFDPRSTSKIRGMFDQESLNKLYQGSYIEQKTNNAIDLFIDVLSNQLIEGSPAFEDDVNRILIECGLRNYADDDTIRKITGLVKAKIKSKYINEYCRRNNIDQAALVRENNTILDRFLSIQAKIMNDPAYEDMLGDNQAPSNYLLRTLVTGNSYEIDTDKAPLGTYKDTYATAKFVKILRSLNDDAIEQDQFTQAWQELLDDATHPDIQQFARDLIVYAFITSGDMGGANNLFKYVPNMWKMFAEDQSYENSYAKYMQDVLNQYKANVSVLTDEDITDIILNSWHDDRLIPSKKIKNFTVWATDNTQGFPLVLGAAKIVTVNTLDNKGKPQSRKEVRVTQNIENSPKYIKLDRPNVISGQRQYIIYKRIGINVVEGIPYPIYAAIEPKGTKMPNGEIILEMGRSDATFSEKGLPITEGKIALSTTLSGNAFWDGILLKEIKDEKSKIFEKFKKDGNVSDFVEALIKLSRLNPVFSAIVEDGTLIDNASQLIGNASLEGETLVDPVSAIPSDIEDAQAQQVEQIQQFIDNNPTQNTYSVPTSSQSTATQLSVNEISNKTEDYGVTLANGSKDLWNIVNNWQKTNPDGIVAYRKHGDDPASFTSQTVNEGWIGNPFSTHSRGEITVQQFYDWLTTGNNFGNNLATEEFRQAIIQKLLSIDEPNILYYTELNRPSHATVLGYLIKNKHLLSNYDNTLGERRASIEEEVATINSNKTILSNEELQYWNNQGVGEMPRILVASERTDPAFHVEEILRILNGEQSVIEWGNVNGRRGVIGQRSGKDFAGLYLITKHDGIPMKKLLETKIPKLIHFSITGLGNTKWEPGVMKPSDLLDRIAQYIEQGLDPNSVTIRIDPIVPGVTTPNMIREIIKRSSEMGIKRIRFSIMDAYPSTVNSMSKLGYDFEKNYGTNSKTGKFNFTAKSEIIDNIVNFMLQMKKEYGITLGTCAEGLSREGISKEGCLSVDSVNQMLGTSIEDNGTENNNQRKLCSCYGGKIDALEYGKNCASHCVYCYAKHDSDAAMQYYNEDGTLKNNLLTNTTYQPTTINIYAGTNENTDLSNFAERRFEVKEVVSNELSSENNAKDTSFQYLYPKPHYLMVPVFRDRIFNTVEGAFQAAKVLYTSSTDGKYLTVDTSTGDVRDVLTEEGQELINKLAHASGVEARALGKSIQGLNTENWDKDSSKWMKGMLLQSFQQNPQALQRLLATGNATLTHVQDKGKWGTEFPKLLMEVREELKQQNSNFDDSAFPDDAMNECKGITK